MLYNYWNDIISNSPLVDYITDKRKSANAIMSYMMTRINMMFEYKNLPDTIPQEILETFLIQNGTCFITKHFSRLYAFLGSMGGEPDEYYRPTLYIVANPALKLSKEYEIGKDGILMRNDTLWVGLTPLMSRYAALMAENLLTIRSADIMLRAVAMITAPDDNSRLSAELYIKKLKDGEISVIGENPFFDGVKMQSPPSNNGSYLTQFIELQQYLKASFYNEIGLDANYNMKREAIMSGESAMNKDILLPLCDNMLKCRQEDIEKVNEMFGTNISVDFASAWKQNMEEYNMAFSQLNGGMQNAEEKESIEGAGESQPESAGSSDNSVANSAENSATDPAGYDNNGEISNSNADNGSDTGHQSSIGNASTNENRSEEDTTPGTPDSIQINIISQLNTEGSEINVSGEEGIDGDNSSDNGGDGDGSEPRDKDSEGRNTTDE